MKHPLSRPQITLSLAAKKSFSKASAKKSWSLQEINRLKELADQHISMKKIAQDMGRSIASINTALDRFNARPIKLSRAKPLQERKRRYFKAEKSKPQALWALPICVSFNTVIQWLQSRNVDVRQTSYFQQERPQCQLFYINNQLVPAYQVVVIANKIRHSLKEPIFHVANITQE